MSCRNKNLFGTKGLLAAGVGKIWIDMLNISTPEFSHRTTDLQLRSNVYLNYIPVHVNAITRVQVKYENMAKDFNACTLLP